MMASSWTEEDSRVAAEKIIKRAEISKVIQIPCDYFDESIHEVSGFDRRVVIPRPTILAPFSRIW